MKYALRLEIPSGDNQPLDWWKDHARQLLLLSANARGLKANSAVAVKVFRIGTASTAQSFVAASCETRPVRNWAAVNPERAVLNGAGS